MTRRPGSCREEESRSRQQLHMAPGRGGGGREGGKEDGYDDDETEGFRWKGLSFFSLSWTETASVAEDFGLEGT